MTGLAGESSGNGRKSRTDTFVFAETPTKLDLQLNPLDKMAIVHIVHFAYNCDEATKQEIASRFLKMQQQCISKTDSKPYILSLTGGKNNSPEGMNDGLEVCEASQHA